MHNNLYKLGWFLTPIIFLALYIYKGAICFMGSCLGNDNEGVAWGIGGVIIYSILLKFAGRGKYWNLNDLKKGFLYYLILLIILLVYFLGKMNG